MALKERLVGCGPSSNRLCRWWNSLWKPDIPPQIKLFIGKVHNSFSSSHNLVKRGISIDTKCKLCSDNFEFSFHVFFHHAFGRDEWKRVRIWKFIKAIANSDLQEMLLHLFSFYQESF